MKKIIAFAGSNSRQSINKQLVTLVASNMSEIEVTILDLNDFELPLYGIDLENDQGIPKLAHDFLALIRSADGLIVSLAEHNGAYSTAFKNLFDWMSRIDGKLWSMKPMLLMATSTGGRGGASVLNIAKTSFPHLGASIVADFSLPKFHETFSQDGIKDEVLQKELDDAIRDFKIAVTESK